MPSLRLLHATLCALTLLLSGSPAGAAACDPSMQSCGPAPSPFPGPGDGEGGGGQSCKPSSGGATCDGSGPASQGGGSGTNQGVGNPINLINGNKYQREVDMPALPGVLGLEIVRHYNSQYSLPNVPSGVLGHGWKLSYETALYDTPVGLQIVQADGSRLIFQKSQRDPSHCSSANPAVGSVTILNKPQGKEYLWRWRGNGSEGGRSLLFNSDGQLVQITAPTGEFVTLLYSPKGWLLQVRDPQGRELNLHYLDVAAAKADPDGNKVFHGVQTIDSPVGRFSYGYGNALPTGSTARPRLTVANLSQVSIPTWYDGSQRSHAWSNISPSRSSITRLYHYEDPRFPTLLTGISVQGSGSDGVPMHQRISTYGYDGRGKAILSQKADGAEKVTLDNSTPGQTVVTNSLGQATRYKHANIAGQWRLLESRGAGCAQCGPANMAYGYDKLGRLTTQTLLDLTGKPLSSTHTTLDAMGRPSRVEQITYAQGKPGPAQLQQRFEYAADNDTEPSLIARPSVVVGREHQIHIRYNARGQPTEITETGFEPLKGQAMTRSTRLGYQSVNGNSLLAAIDGPLPNGPLGTPQDSDITRLVWDKAGNYITAVTQPGGTLQTIRNDPGTGLITRVENAEGFYTEFVYNTRTQLSTLRSGGPGWKQPVVQSIRYDAFGNPTESGSGEDLGGNQRFMVRSKQSFDALGRLQWSADALGILSQYRFDSESHLLGTGRYSNAMAQVQNYAYDVLGQLISVSDNQGQGYQIRYNAQGHPTQVIDALGRDVLAGTTSHSLHSRQLKDDFGRSVATISPDSGTTTRDFDAADRLVESTDAKGNQARYGYDPRGRIQQQTIRDASTAQAQTTTWEYLGSRLIALHHPLQSERYGYDARGLRTEKITTLTTPQGRFTRVTSYQYDDWGVLQSSSLPDGSQVVYTRNGQGQVVGVMREHIRTPWLRWTAPAQVIAKDLQRDIMGLKHYTTGNDIEAEFQRSRDGALARVLYRQTREPALQTAGSHLPALLGQTTQEFIDLLLGIRPAQAAPASANSDKPSPPDAAPGALGLAPDPRAFIDHRYLWDVRGNLLHMQSRNKQAVLQQNYAYDGQDRLLVAASTRSTSRYFYDAAGRRALSQQDVADPSDFKTNTIKTRFEPNTHRRAGTDSIQSRLDANGQPQSIGQRDYVWDALGKLTALREQDRTLANYRYNHRGERIAKTVGIQSWSFLYDNQQLVGELNAQGQLIRQYVYLADQPVAVIDTPEGQSLRRPDASAITDIVHDLQTIGSVWFGSTPMVWLHTNHLGAPEAATDASGKLVWQARYAPFGQAAINSPGFSLNLRLPGQYEDAETGLYYNRQRYYDPQAGQYLTPDPLGTPSGPNGYAYVRYNPLKYVDPDGLILFAFDGTGNDERNASTLSNVVNFRNLYQSDQGTNYYITGPGTTDPRTQIGPSTIDPGGVLDMASAYTGKDRIAALIGDLENYANSVADDTAIDIDIMGFSRGAAEARDFANQIVNAIDSNGYFKYSSKDTNGIATNYCQKLNFRFMGLFDTVLSTHSGSYNLAIPDKFHYVAQALALNEYRPLFPGVSILGGTSSSGDTRIERGFLGSHSDIGGGFTDGDLSKIALNWMVNQATEAGVTMDVGRLDNTVIANPTLHDKSSVLYSVVGPAPSTISQDRTIAYENGPTVEGRVANIGGMSYAATQQFINYSSNPVGDVSGTVNAQAYLNWLKAAGYGINMTVQ